MIDPSTNAPPSRRRILRFFLPPLAGLMMISGLMMWDQYRTHQTIQAMKPALHRLLSLDVLLHEIQNERSLSAGLLGATDDSFRKPLLARRKTVRETVANLRQPSERGADSSGPGQWGRQWQRLMERLAALTAIRDAVDAGGAEVGEIIDGYADVNLTLLATIASFNAVFTDPAASRVHVALFNFMHLVETAGIERAILTHAFARDRLTPGLRDRLLRLQGERTTHTELYLSFSTPAEKAHFETIRTEPDTIEINRLCKLVMTDAGSGGFGIDAHAWHERASRRIKRLHDIEQRLEKRLFVAVDAALQKSRNTFWLYGIGTTILIGTGLLLALTILKSMRNVHLEREIAHRKRIETALADQTRLLKMVLDNVQQGLVAYDKDLRLIVCNRRFHEIRGAPEHLSRPGAHFVDWIRHDIQRGEFGPGDAEEQLQFHLQRARRPGTHHFERSRPDGTVLQVTGSTLPNGGFVSTFTDITRQKEAERQQAMLMRELAFQKQALDHHAIVSATDLKGDITYVNDLFCQISGYDHEELIGRNHRLVNSGVHPKSFFKTLWGTILKGEVWHGEVCNRCKDGSLYWVRATVVPFLDESGRAQKFVSIRTDITEHKLAEARIARSLASQSLLKHLLSLPIQDHPIGELLNRALELILHAGLLDLQERGAIFLTNKTGTGLEMAAHSGLPASMVSACGRVANGHCLCGRVAVSRVILFATHEALENGSGCEETDDHGHYCVPIRSEETLLGVLTLYVPTNAPDDAEVREILQAIGDTLGMIVDRKQAETALKTMTDKLRDAQRMVRMGNWERNLVDNSAQWSEVVYEILGRPFQDRASFEQALAFIVPEDRQRVLHTVETSLKNERDCVVEYRIQRPDGEIRHVYSAGRITERSEDDGRPLTMAGTLLDITDRKRAEERIARSLENQALLKQLLSLSIEDHGLDVLMERALSRILDISFTASERMGAIFFKKADGGLEMMAQSGLHAHLTTACRTVASGHCLCGRVAVSGELLFIDHVEDRHDIRFDGMADHGHYCVPIRSGETMIGVLTLYVPVGHRDTGDERELLIAVGNTLGVIIERKRAQRELVKLSTAVQCSPVSVMVTDAGATIEYVNEKFTDITGYRADEAIGRKTGLLRSGKTDPALYRELWETVTAGKPWYGRMLNRKKDGSHYWHQLAISPIKGADGRISQYVSVGEDISDQITLLEERDEAMQLVNGSIRYASRIQRAILPRRAVLEKAFPEYFVLWEPRDVVGGDMYWYRSWGRGALVVLGDCTGHGVPGAFMTLISNGALDEAYLETPPGDPATLLQRMHQLIQSSLGQDRADLGDADDGIELGACYINANRSALVFAGARFDLFILKDGVVTTVKGNKSGLGYRGTPREVRFTNHEVDLADNPTFYMTSDGLIDQIGGPMKRGFGKRRFRSLLTSLADTPLAEQDSAILKALVAFQGAQKRRDDLSVIGFKVQTAKDSPARRNLETLDPSLLVGYEPIDADHRRLMTLIGKLNEAIVQGYDRTLTLGLLDGLINYTSWHFRHEERLMQISDYPHTDDHKRDHRHLVEQVLTIQRDIQENHSNVSSQLMLFLLNWLNEHIHAVDQKLADHLNGVAVTPPTPELYFVLDGSLLVGYEAIDDDHQKLVDLVNQLHVADLSGAGRPVTMAILDELVDYTSWHFRHEERLMQSNDYPDLRTHKAAHAGLIVRIHEIQNKFKLMDEQAPSELNALVKSWLINHIHEVDKKLADFLRNG